jgi:hypothetical protein
MDAVAVNVVGGDRVAAELPPGGQLAPWSKRVRWVGGLIQAAFAAFWLARGSLVIGGAARPVLLVMVGVAMVGAFAYAITAGAGTAPRPTDPQGRRIERQITIATVLEFAAALVLPVLVSAAGHPDWVLPSIAITIGPLLLWLDHRVSVPRYRLAGWALTVGPVILVLVLSGTSLVATTGLSAGVLLLSTALAGFHDLAQTRRAAQGAHAEDAAALSADGVQS